MARLSIRLRLTVWYSGILLLGMLLFGSGMWLALRQRLLDAIDARLAQRVQGVRTVLDLEGWTPDRRHLQDELSEFAREVPDGTVIHVRDSAGALLNSAGPQAYQGQSFRTLKAGIESGGQRYEVVVAAPLEEIQVVMRDFRNLLLLLIPAVLAAACLGGYWISRRALAPVDEITRVARSITVQNLSRRLVVPNTGDELQRMSETWNEVLERLDAAVGRIRRFTADASHELRTPVALIRATAELSLRRERDAGQYRKSLREIQSEAERMTALTESLLRLARADSDGADMPLAPTDLNRIAAEVVRRNEPLAETRGVALGADLVDGAATAVVNEAGIRRLLLILMENALQHTPAGGSVTVSTRLCDGGVCVSVQDTGEGIAPQALPHIFERFFRADQSRGDSAGAGLGLSIAQMIADAHGSRISVESKPGSGSCFQVTLPT